MTAITIKRKLLSTSAVAVIALSAWSVAGPAAADCAVGSEPIPQTNVWRVPAGATVECETDAETRSFDGRPDIQSPNPGSVPAVGFDANIRQGATLVAPGSGASNNSPALFFGPGSALLVDQGGRIESPGGGNGAVTFTGAGSTADNRGTISVTGRNAAIQGGFRDGEGLADGLALTNSGTIETIDPSTSAGTADGVTVNLRGADVSVDNSGTISRTGLAGAALGIGPGGVLRNSGDISFALSGVQNADPLIRSGGTAVIVTGVGGQIRNDGTIRASGAGSVAISGVGAARTSANTVIENGVSGQILGENGASGIRLVGDDTSVVNAGRLASPGGTALDFSGENGSLVMRAGATLEGDVTATTTATALRTIKEIGLDSNNPANVAAYNTACRRPVPERVCLKTVRRYPAEASVTYETAVPLAVDPSVTRFSGVNRFVLDGPGSLSLSQDFAAGNEVEGTVAGAVPSGNFSNRLEFAIGDPAATVTLDGAIGDNPDDPARFRGSLLKTGAGTLTLTGDSRHTGGTAVEGGTLRLGDGGQTGSLTGDVAIAGGAALEVNRRAALTLPGVLSGDGRFRAVRGATFLTGENTYSGGTTIDRTANLTVGDGGTSGAILGDVANEGSLSFRRSDDLSFDGIISGSGTVGQAGTGTLTLTGDHTYTGRTVVANGGTLDLAGSLTSDVLVARSVRATSNSRLTGDGSTTGGVTIRSGGILAPGAGLGTMSIGSLDLQAGGVIEIDAIEATTGGLAADRIDVAGRAVFGTTGPAGGLSYGPTVIDVTFEDDAPVPALEGITILSAAGGLEGRAPNVVLDPASLPNGFNFHLDLEATNLGNTFAVPGEIIPDGAGGAGVVVLQVLNADPDYVTPPQITAINAPYLVPAPSRAPVLAPSQVPTIVPQAVPVLAPALVKGTTAKVTTPVVAPQPGMPPVRTGITVANHGAAVGGVLTPQPQTAQGTNVSPTTVPVGTVSSVVVVEPPAEVVTTDTVFVPIDNTNTDVVIVEPPAEAVTTGFVSVSGTYTGIDQTNARPGTRYALVYRPHSVGVAKIPENHGNLAPLGVTQTTTQQQVGGALTELLPQPHARPATTEQARLVSELYPLDLAEINDTLDSVAGVDTDPTFVAVMNTRHFQDTLDDRLADLRAPGAGSTMSSQGRRDAISGVAMWGEILGSYAEGDYLGGSDIRRWGLALGADKDFGNGFVGGIALGYSDASISTDAGPSSDVQTAEVALYGSWTQGAWFAGANVGAAHSWLDFGRETTIGNARFDLDAEAEAQSWFLGVEAGRNFATTWGTVAPSMGLRYQHLERDGFTENGSAILARDVSSETLESVQGILGLRINGAERGRGAFRWRPEFRVAYAHEFGDTDIDGTASLIGAPGSSFDVFTEGPGDDIGIFGMRLTRKGAALDYYVDLQAEAREGLVGGQVRFGLSMSF